MKVFQKYRKFLVAVALVVFGAIINTMPTFAADLPEYRIQMSPAISDVGDLKPGSTFSGKFKVQNTGTKQFDYTISISPYSVIDEAYTSDFESMNQYTDIVEWITLSKTSGSVDPNGEDEVAYTIKVPADVPAGGQYAILAAQLIPEDGENEGGTNIKVAQQVGMKLYANVQGNTRRTGSVVENKISGILFNPPIQATSIVENTGNTHTAARYILQVFPLFGNEEIYTNEEDPITLNILPETRRFNTVTWQGAPHLGIFRVKQTVTIFDETSTTEKIVFLCPIWLIFVILLLIFCLVFWIVSRVRGRNKD